ncbi:NAD(P)-binding domain-containing protein [Bacillus licheniformis]
MQHSEIVIVGAGPAGIGMGIVLKKLGFKSFTILEKRPCRSFIPKLA